MNREEICNYAEEIAYKYNPEGLSPFPYEKITEDKKDLSIFLVEFPEGVSGATIYSPEVQKFRILVNKDKPRNRQNFTIAHELGHYFLHQEILKNEEVLVDGDGSLDTNNTLFRLDVSETNRIETEANNFAATLLMPKDLVISAWSTLKNIEECAKIFNVSVSAMSIRLERLGLI